MVIMFYLVHDHHYCYVIVSIAIIECCAEKHRGFAFVEFELAEDAAAAIDNLASYFLALYYSIIYGRHYLPIFAVIC